jgi:phosphoribosyl 1,2-cyclic phosphodiesterase
MRLHAPTSRLRFASLGSGSSGNGALIAVDGTCVLVDCGFTLKETVARLARLGLTGRDLTAILITHEHGDHIDGAGVLARKFKLPVWMTAGTWRAYSRCRPQESLPALNLFSSHEAFAIGALHIQPFPVPHDAREPAQFVFSDGRWRVGLLTDTGSGTTHIEACLSACDALLLECNHDRGLLLGGNYPPSLKQRIAGPYGHLDNASAAGILGKLDNRRLQHLVAMHLSEKNNRPDLARAALSGALDCAAEWIQVADQALGLSWRELMTA